MLRPGNRVEKFTKKVGQKGETGKIVSSHDEAYEIKWDDGHTSVISRDAVHKVNDKKK